MILGYMSCGDCEIVVSFFLFLQLQILGYMCCGDCEMVISFFQFLQLYCTVTLQDKIQQSLSLKKYISQKCFI